MSESAVDPHLLFRIHEGENLDDGTLSFQPKRVLVLEIWGVSNK
jgi:hypothetical protein